MQADLWRRVTSYVDRVLKGAKPADLPVELPTKYEPVLNLRVFEGSMVRQMLDKNDHDGILTVEHRFLVVLCTIPLTRHLGQGPSAARFPGTSSAAFWVAFTSVAARRSIATNTHSSVARTPTHSLPERSTGEVRSASPRCVGRGPPEIPSGFPRVSAPAGLSVRPALPNATPDLSAVSLP